MCQNTNNSETRTTGNWLRYVLAHWGLFPSQASPTFLRADASQIANSISP